MMAGTYLAAIRTVHHGGPLHIGGASFGGAVAFEIAKRVSSDGGELGSLILIDTPGPSQRWRNRADIEVFAYLLGLQISFPIPSSELAELPLEPKLGLLLELTRQSRQEDLLPPYDQLLKVWNTCTANAAALWKYKIQQHHLPITYFLADERDEYTPTDPTIEWRRHALARFDLHHVQGNHITMLQSPNVASIASVVSKILKAQSTQRLSLNGAVGET
jgi:thioesterase domain-containing protein